MEWTECNNFTALQLAFWVGFYLAERSDTFFRAISWMGRENLSSISGNMSTYPTNRTLKLPRTFPRTYSQFCVFRQSGNLPSFCRMSVLRLLQDQGFPREWTRTVRTSVRWWKEISMLNTCVECRTHSQLKYYYDKWRSVGTCTKLVALD